MARVQTTKPLQRFWGLLKPDRREIGNVYVYAVFNGLVNLSLPLGIQAIINLIQGGRMNTAWYVLVGFVVAGIAVTGVLQIFQLRITENLQQKIFSRAAFEFVYRIPRIRMESIYRHYAPELMNRFFDTMSVQKGLAKILIDFSAASLQVLFGLLLLSLYHPFFILFSVILILLIYAIFQFTGAKGLRTSLAESKEKYRVAHWLEELARTQVTFKLAGDTNLPLHRVDRRVGDYLKARQSHFGVLLQQYSLMVGFKVLVASGLLILGGILVMDQQMNVGQFVAAEIIILLVMASVEKLVLSMETIYDVLTSLEKIGQVTDLELEGGGAIDLGEACPEGGLSVHLDRVSFSYPDRGRKTLDDLSLQIAGGEKVMITGSTGSGKSTLLSILAGLYEVHEGSVAYAGLARTSLAPDSVRAVIGDVLSQEQLFEGSVLENITMGRQQIGLDEVRQLVRNMGLETFINSLPQGLETQLDPGGKKLPRGIVQKLLLVRSMVHRPKLLLLERALEYIESSERNRIIDFLTDQRNDWTMIAVSDDPYLASRCTRVVTLEDGRIIETTDPRSDEAEEKPSNSYA